MLFSYGTVSTNLHFSSSNRFSNMVTRILILITSVNNKIKKVRDGSLWMVDVFLRMLLEAQTKLALKEAEAERTRESCLAQITKLQEKLKEQTEDLQKKLEADQRSR